MKFLDAAYIVLKQADTPLHFAEITSRALSAGILDTKGQTPEATMGSRLYVDTKRPDSRFRRVDTNYFALAEAAPTKISQQIEALNDQARIDLRKRLGQMPPDKFEALIGELLLALGFDEDTIQVTSYSRDGGIDVRGVLSAGNLTEVKAAVQVKRWKANVQTQTVQALRGALTVHEQGIIITTGEFSRGSIQEAQAAGKARISLVDGDKLLDLLMDHRIGVKAEQYTVFALDEEWWKGVVAPSTDAASPFIPQPQTTIPRPLVFPVVYPLAIEANAQGRTYYAELLDQSGRVKYNGTEYKSPSGAGQVATGWKSCNGWTLWRYQHSTTGEWRSINELR